MVLKFHCLKLNHDIQDYHQLCYLKPKQPKTDNSRELYESWLIKITCSWTSSNCELNNLTNTGKAPASITQRVWCELPDAMFVSAHAASNYSRRNKNLEIIKFWSITCNW